MPNIPAAPNTLATLQAVQSLILTNALIGGVSPFAALTTADAARYGVARAIFIGAPKDFRDAYLPQCHIAPEADSVALQGAQGRAHDELRLRLTCVADFTDWWQAEQTILNLRDALWPVILAHVRGGASAAASLIALDLPDHSPESAPTFTTLLVAGVYYRAWSCSLIARQLWSPTTGLQP